MADLYFDSEADAALTRLENDSARPQLKAVVDRVLDQLEVDPGDRSVRRLRFTNGLWAVVVRGEEDYVILWEPHPDDPDGVIIHHLGSASFT